MGNVYLEFLEILNMQETEGREREFTELLAEHRGEIFGYLFALVHNLADAEDLYQQTSLTLWDKFDDFTLGTNFGAWARTVSHYLALNFLRQRQGERVRFSDQFLESLAAEDPLAVDHEEAAFREEALQFCMEKLKESDRQVVRACYSHSSTIKGVAQEMGRSPAGVYKSLARIRQILFECISRKLRTEDRS